jgi:polyisoprenoid-binding protein YceI
MTEKTPLKNRFSERVLRIFIFGVFLSLVLFSNAQSFFEMNGGVIKFESKALLENITATSNQTKGIVNIAQNTFAFSVEINSFKGFNSDLQKEHFNENYLESDIYTKSTFTGKLIDKFDPTKATQTIRSKGQLEIHGVKQERIISVTLVKSGNNYTLSADFNVLLADFGISVPRIVNQKIAEIIFVTIRGTIKPKQ